MHEHPDPTPNTVEPAHSDNFLPSFRDAAPPEATDLGLHFELSGHTFTAFDIHVHDDGFGHTQVSVDGHVIATFPAGTQVGTTLQGSPGERATLLITADDYRPSHANIEHGYASDPRLQQSFALKVMGVTHERAHSPDTEARGGHEDSGKHVGTVAHDTNHHQTLAAHAGRSHEKESQPNLSPPGDRAAISPHNDAPQTPSGTVEDGYPQPPVAHAEYPQPPAQQKSILGNPPEPRDFTTEGPLGRTLRIPSPGHWDPHDPKYVVAGTGHEVLPDARREIDEKQHFGRVGGGTLGGTGSRDFGGHGHREGGTPKTELDFTTLLADQVAGAPGVELLLETLFGHRDEVDTGGLPMGIGPKENASESGQVAFAGINFLFLCLEDLIKSGEKAASRLTSAKEIVAALESGERGAMHIANKKEFIDLMKAQVRAGMCVFRTNVTTDSA